MSPAYLQKDEQSLDQFDIYLPNFEQFCRYHRGVVNQMPLHVRQFEIRYRQKYIQSAYRYEYAPHPTRL